MQSKVPGLLVDVTIGQKDAAPPTYGGDFSGGGGRRQQQQEQQPLPGHCERVEAGIVVASFNRAAEVTTDKTMLSGNRRKLHSSTGFKATRNSTTTVELIRGKEVYIIPCTAHPGRNSEFYTLFTWTGNKDDLIIEQLLPGLNAGVEKSIVNCAGQSKISAHPAHPLLKSRPLGTLMGCFARPFRWRGGGRGGLASQCGAPLLSLPANVRSVDDVVGFAGFWNERTAGGPPNTASRNQ